MQNPLTSLAEIIWTIFKIRRSPLPNKLKRKVIITYIKTFALKRINRKDKLADILCYRIRYCNEVSLRYLFDEILVSQDYLIDLGKSDPVIIDCGSNIGLSVLFFKTLYPKAVIFAFEPDHDAFKCLTENVSANKIQSVTLNNKAVSSREGVITFYIDPARPGALTMSTFQERMPKQAVEVEAVLLSNHVSYQVDLLKIDVEGAEMDVLDDLYSTGKIKYIKSMIIEYHHHLVSNDDAMSKLLSLLERSGFGYQVCAKMRRPLPQSVFQDILVYAYRKADTIVEAN